MMDIESYAEWERLAIELMMRERIAPAAGLDAIAAATIRIAAWSPGGTTPLLHAVREGFDMPAPPAAALALHEPALKRWLAARLFGNWIAYQGDGLDAIVRYLRRCLATFTTELARDGSPLEAIRRSDLLIVHNA